MNYCTAAVGDRETPAVFKWWFLRAQCELWQNIYRSYKGHAEPPWPWISRSNSISTLRKQMVYERTINANGLLDDTCVNARPWDWRCNSIRSPANKQFIPVLKNLTCSLTFRSLTQIENYSCCVQLWHVVEETFNGNAITGTCIRKCLAEYKGRFASNVGAPSETVHQT